MPDAPRIALIQMAPIPHDPPANLARMETFLAQARDRNADLAVFPENCLVGAMSTRPDLADKDGWYARSVAALARKYALDLVPGSHAEREGDKLFNTAYYLDRSGEILGRYRKINLWLSEKGMFERGRDTVVCETRFGRVGLSICWDLAFPELYRRQFEQQARLMICVAHWCLEDAGPGLRRNPRAEPILIDACCIARACENEAAFLFCNSGGIWKGKSGDCRSAGRTQMALPFLGATDKIEDGEESALNVCPDLSILDEAETAYEQKRDKGFA